MLILLPLAAAALRGFSLPGWFLLPESVLLVIPLRILYWEKGGGRWGDYLGGILHVYLYFFFLHNTAPIAPYLVAPILGLWWLAERALYFGLKKFAPVALAGAAAVIAADWFRFQWPMGGVPWGSLAHGMADRPVARDWASVIGESGWVVLLALFGAALYSTFGPKRSRREHLLEVLPASLLILTAATMVEPRAEVRDSIRTLSIQGNLSIDEKHGSWGIQEVFGRQARVTERGLAAEPEAEFVIWCETMYPIPVTPPEGSEFAETMMIRPWPGREEMRTTQYLREVNATNIVSLIGPPELNRRFITGAHFYLGVPEKEAWRPGEPREPDTWSPRTSEFLAFGPDGTIEDHFSKSELVPFGERLPFLGKFPGGEWLALEMLRVTRLYPRFASSGRVGPLNTRGHTLGGAVCWENVYEGVFRDQADQGAEAFLILSNENWYRLSREMDQMVASTRFRAAETGRPILRAANTGITALFDDRGAVLGQLPRGVEGWFGADLHLIDGDFRTPYQRWGWLLQPLIAWLALIGAGIGLILGRRAQASVGAKEGFDPSLDPSPGHR